MTVKRLWRCTATYPNHVATRHFQTERAARSWVTHRETGYPGFSAIRDAIPPAEHVTIEPSNPITWPTP